MVTSGEAVVAALDGIAAVSGWCGTPGVSAVAASDEAAALLEWSAGVEAAPVARRADVRRLKGLNGR